MPEVLPLWYSEAYSRQGFYVYTLLVPVTWMQKGGLSTVCPLYCSREQTQQWKMHVNNPYRQFLFHPVSLVQWQGTALQGNSWLICFYLFTKQECWKILQSFSQAWMFRCTLRKMSLHTRFAVASRTGACSYTSSYIWACPVSLHPAMSLTDLVFYCRVHWQHGHDICWKQCLILHDGDIATYDNANAFCTGTDSVYFTPPPFPAWEYSQVPLNPSGLAQMGRPKWRTIQTSVN